MTDVGTLTLAEFLLARIAEDEARAGNFRSMPLGEVDCPCGKRGHLSRAGNEYEITHTVGWAPPWIDESSWVYGAGHPVTETHVLVGAEADALFLSFPVSEQSRRVLAECEAKRKIIELHHRNRYQPTQCAECGWVEDWEVDENGPTYPCVTLQTLAAVYASHPDSRDGWGERRDEPEEAPGDHLPPRPAAH